MVVLRRRSLELLIPKIFGRSHHDDPYDLDLRLNSSFFGEKDGFISSIRSSYHPLSSIAYPDSLVCPDLLGRPSHSKVEKRVTSNQSYKRVVGEVRAARDRCRPPLNQKAKNPQFSPNPTSIPIDQYTSFWHFTNS